jgi:hypothetical protein
VTISRWRRIRFHWLFLSQKGLRALPNPRITFGRCFDDDFSVGINSVFVDYFLVNRGWQLFQIHASPLKGVSVMIFQSAPTLFSLTEGHELFRLHASSLKGVSLMIFQLEPNPFSLTEGCELFLLHTSPLEGVSVTISKSAPTPFSLNFYESTASTSDSASYIWKVFRWWFPSRYPHHFHWFFMSQQGLRALPNPRVTFGRCFGDDFLVGINFISVD